MVTIRHTQDGDYCPKIEVLKGQAVANLGLDQQQRQCLTDGGFTINADLSSIRFLVLDFDGVMTDNRVFVTEEGQEMVVCSRGDGMGIQLAQAKGLDVLVLSKERNPVVQARCRKLGVPCIQGQDNKLPVLEELTRDRGLKSQHVAYVGNDVNDLECMEWAGLGIAVADAHAEAMAVADSVTSERGGRGAVREVCDAWMAQNAD